jgi:hypothetical protein
MNALIRTLKADIASDLKAITDIYASLDRHSLESADLGQINDAGRVIKGGCVEDEIRRVSLTPSTVI